MPWEFTEEADAPFRIAPEGLRKTEGIRLTGPETRVLLAREGTPVLTAHAFGQGRAVYMGDFFYSPAAARMLLEMLVWLTGTDGSAAGWTDRAEAECAWFPESGTLVVMNNSGRPLDVNVVLPGREVQAHPGAGEMCFLPV